VTSQTSTVNADSGINKNSLYTFHVSDTAFAMAETKGTAVDTTPISPVREGLERRNSLEKHLAQRPDVQDLKNRHILLDTNAAP
jgi:hypothetical protein